MKTLIRQARSSDGRRIKALLKKAELPYEDVEIGRQTFLVATAGGRIVGTVGVEAYGKHGLLRSLAVDEELRDHGLGSELTGEMVEKARSIGVRELYLLTLTAAQFFEKHGFERTERAKAPAALQGTTEFASLCPVSSVCMRKRLSSN
ncbi:MAG TPA: arsenic resistance N-acetyltransferase ArsN2 [Methanocella sp.]|jgi:amino-acid N-acetyltransferase